MVEFESNTYNGLLYRFYFQRLEIHMKSVNKTQQDFSEFLANHNVTAVFELCDDDFEEHILPYRNERKGLYLHGINQNTIIFSTWKSKRVQDVAHEWGFHPTVNQKSMYKAFDYHNNGLKKFFKELSSIEEVQQFTDEPKKKGEFQNRPIEGFVVRTTFRENNQDFFFKIKYDHPYLMYREWREVTKAVLKSKSFRVRYPLTHHYIEWVKRKFTENPTLFDGFFDNHNIIKIRDMFLNDNNLKAEDIVQASQIADITNDDAGSVTNNKILLLPVATIGSGKTTLAKVLRRLLDFGLVQNDDLAYNKNKAQNFYQKILLEFKSKDIVFADRNNHFKRLRQSLENEIKKVYPKCQVICFHWDIAQYNVNDIYSLSLNRVVERGENHQTLTPSRTPNMEQVILSFIKQREPLGGNNDIQPDKVIEMNIMDDLSTSIRYGVQNICKELQLSCPSEPDIDAAIEMVKQERVTIVHDIVTKTKPIYYGLEIQDDVLQLIFQNDKVQHHTHLLQFKQFLDDHQRIGHFFHVTLVHKTLGDDDNKDRKDGLWSNYETLSRTNPVYWFKIDKIVWNKDLIFATLLDFPLETMDQPHITLATTTNTIKAVEANKLYKLIMTNGGFQNLHAKYKTDIQWIPLDPLQVSGKLRPFYF